MTFVMRELTTGTINGNHTQKVETNLQQLKYYFKIVLF